jgi:hypothetical protein
MYQVETVPNPSCKWVPQNQEKAVTREEQEYLPLDMTCNHKSVPTTRNKAIKKTEKTM